MILLVITLLLASTSRAFEWRDLLSWRIKTTTTTTANVQENVERNAVALWTLHDIEKVETFSSSTTASIMAAIVKRAPLILPIDCARSSVASNVKNPCESANDEDLRALAIALTNCHLTASGRRTYESVLDMDDAAFGAYTLFYSDARETCTSFQSEIVATEQRIASRELAVVARETVIGVANVGKTLAELTAQGKKAIVETEEGFNRLAQQGLESMENTRAGFEAVSKQAERVAEESASRIEKLGRMTAEAHNKQLKLIEAQEAMAREQERFRESQVRFSKAMEASIHTSFGSAQILSVVAWYTSASVACLVITSFGIFQRSRQAVFTMLVMSAISEYVVHVAIAGTGLDVFIGATLWVRWIGAFLSLGTVLAFALKSFVGGKTLAEQHREAEEEERFIRYITKYLMHFGNNTL